MLGKVEIIERCVRRVREVHGGDSGSLRRDLTRQESVLLNLQRAAEAAIDLAMHLVRVDRLGLPKASREAFDLLEQAGTLPADLATALRGMVGFRNVAVHDYRKLDLDVVEAIVAHHLDDLLTFARLALRTRGAE
ncbi:MAG: DUF86 domain-containing protein [Trueperaceae bacterium]|nr:DUF86 domain-containing protein [Trueperaceae bacterium]